MLRSAARQGSHPDWKDQDPQIPKSIWYHTDAAFLGFRVVRPYEPPAQGRSPRPEQPSESDHADQSARSNATQSNQLNQ